VIFKHRVAFISIWLQLNRRTIIMKDRRSSARVTKPTLAGCGWQRTNLMSNGQTVNGDSGVETRLYSLHHVTNNQWADILPWNCSFSMRYKIYYCWCDVDGARGAFWVTHQLLVLQLWINPLSNTSYNVMSHNMYPRCCCCCCCVTFDALMSGIRLQITLIDKSKVPSR